MSSEFDWSTGRVVSISALLDAANLSDVQIEAVKDDLAKSVTRYAPGTQAAVKAARAEAGSRSYRRVGPKIEVGDR